MILVTGATGFIGSAVCRELTRRNSSWVGLGRSRLVASPSVEGARGGQAFHWDHTQLTNCLTRFRPDAIIHLAGPAVSDTSEQAQIHRSVIEDVLTACRKTTVRPAFVYGSSAAVYGARPTTAPIDEDDALAPVSSYGRVKVECEERLTEAGEQGAVRPTIARIFNVVGPGQRIGMLNDLLSQLVHDDDSRSPTHITMRNLKPVRDYVDVRDVARWLTDLAQRMDPVDGGVLNLSAERAISVADMVALVSETVGRLIDVRELEPEAPSDCAVGSSRKRRLVFQNHALVPLRKSIADMVIEREQEAA